MLRYYYNKFQGIFNDALTGVIVLSILFSVFSYYHLNYYNADKYIEKSGLTTSLSIGKYQYKTRSSKNFGGNNKENLKLQFDLKINNFKSYLTNYKYNIKQIFLYLVLQYGEDNEIILFDKIISIDDINKMNDLVIQNQWSDSVWDMKDSLSQYQEDFNFKVRYDVQPKVGFLTTKEFDIDHLEKAVDLL